MRATQNQQLAANIVDRFGDPNEHRRSERTLLIWADTVAQFVADNPLPVPMNGMHYQTSSVGEAVAIGKTGSDDRTWVFERVDLGPGDPHRYVAIHLDSNLWELLAAPDYEEKNDADHAD